MITLFNFGRAFGLPDASPFVTKVEVLLKMAGLEYTLDPSGFNKAPKGKIPYIDDNGTKIADSTFIRWHLEDKHGADFSGGYSKAELATGWAFEKLIEDNIYWAVVESRWLVDKNFDAGPAVFFKKIPGLIRPLITRMIRRKVAKNLYAQGTGRHSRPEIEKLAIAGINAIADFLGDKPYFLGDRPCGYDPLIFASISGVLCPIFDSPIRTAAEARPNLRAYSERMLAEYYPSGF